MEVATIMAIAFSRTNERAISSKAIDLLVIHKLKIMLLIVSFFFFLAHKEEFYFLAKKKYTTTVPNPAQVKRKEQTQSTLDRTLEPNQYQSNK
jgi:hypothetical protein